MPRGANLHHRFYLSSILLRVRWSWSLTLSAKCTMEWSFVLYVFPSKAFCGWNQTSGVCGAPVCLLEDCTIEKATVVGLSVDGLARGGRRLHGEGWLIKSLLMFDIALDIVTSWTMSAYSCSITKPRGAAHLYVKVQTRQQ